MKQALGILVAIGISLYVVFLWGRLFVDVLLHPIRAFQFVGFPLLVVVALTWLMTRRSRSLDAEVKSSIQNRGANDQLEIAVNEAGQWSQSAVDAARDGFRSKPISAQVEAVAELRTNN